MALEQESKRRTSRKLIKKRKPQRHTSVQFPERLKLKEGEDIYEDVTSGKGNPSQHMNQSVFSMIAAAGSRVDFHARFENESSDSEEDKPSSSLPDVSSQGTGVPLEGDIDTPPQLLEKSEKVEIQRGRKTASRATRALPELSLKTIEEQKYLARSGRLPSSTLLSPISSATNVTPRDAPVMSMMLEAQAQLDPSLSHSCTQKGELDSSKQLETHSSLVIRLMEIFGFEKPEEVISGMFSRRS